MTLAKALNKAVAQTVGRNVKRYRNKKGWTQLVLGHAIGCTGPEAGSYICRVENGAQEPRIRQLEKIASALGVSIRDLILKNSENAH